MKHKFADRAPEPEELDSAFSEVRDYNLKDSSFLVMYKTRDGIGAAQYNASSFESGEFGRILLAGSGAGVFYSCLETFESPKDKTLHGRRDIARTFILSALSYFHAMELYNGGGLGLEFGGGYELLAYSHHARRFEKLTDVMYVFWRYNINNPHKLELVERIYKVDYINDFLVVRNMTFDADGAKIYNGLESNILSNRQIIVPPLVIGQKFENVWLQDLPNINGPNVVHNVLCEPTGEEQPTLAFVDLNLATANSIYVDIRDDKLCIQFNHEYTNYMLETLLEKLAP